MATDNQEEYEQGEQVRTWLRQNGGSVVGGIVVGLALIAGWQWWQAKQSRHGQEAAAAYASLSTTLTANGDAKRISALAASVHSAYPGTPYDTLATMRIAAYKLDHDDAKGALAELDRIGKISDPALKTVVQLRGARLLLILDRPAEALTRAEPIKDPAFAAVAGEIRGDAQRALGHMDAARQAYSEALGHLPDTAPSREIIETKLTEIGGVAPKPEAKKA